MNNEEWVEWIITLLKRDGKNLLDAIAICGTAFCLLSLQAKEQLPAEEFRAGVIALTELYQQLLLKED